MKRVFLVLAVLVLLLTVSLVPVNAAGTYVANTYCNLIDFECDVEPGTYTMHVYADVDGVVHDFRSDPFVLSRDLLDKSAIITVNGVESYEMWPSCWEDGYTCIEIYSIQDALILDGDSGIFRITFDSTTRGDESFFDLMNDGIPVVISWVAAVLMSFVATGGAGSPLLAAFVVGIAFSALFLGIKVLRRFIWGA